MVHFSRPTSLAFSREESTAEPRASRCDHCNTVAWIASACFLLIIIFLLIPDWLQAEQPALTKIQERSLELNERGVAAASTQNYVRAEALLKEALSTDTGNISAAVNLASVLMAQQRNTEALQILEDYKSQAADDPGFYAQLADVYFSSKKTDLALETYKKVLSLDPAFPAVHAKIATIYSLKNDLKSSEFYFDQALELDKKNASLYGSLASIKLANGKIDEAIAHAKRAIQLKPTKEVYVTLGTAYELQNDLKSSMIAFERARDLGDTRPELQDKINAFKDTL